MRVRIYSWFRSGNIGDILIAERIHDLFSSVCDCRFFDIGSGLPAERPERIPYTPQTNGMKAAILSRPILRELLSLRGCLGKKKYAPFLNIEDEAELAVFAGGNSVMELSSFIPANSIILYRRISLLKQQGYKIAFCFCGCGPFHNGIGKQYARKTIALMDFLSTRDENSFEICKGLGWTGSRQVWRDPVLSYHPPMKERTQNLIAVNVYFGSNRRLHHGMRNAYTQLIQELLATFPDKAICLFVSESADTPQAMSVFQVFLNSERVQIRTVESADDLFDLYRSSLVVIGVRMHALITAMISRTPIVAISWQDKVASLMGYFEKEKYLVSQEEFIDNPVFAAEMMHAAIQMYDMETADIETKLIDIAQTTKANVIQFLKEMERECDV